MKSKREREKKMILQMIELYCLHNLKMKYVSSEYQELSEYACQRLDHCFWKDEKPTCKNCTIHCYTADKRETIRKVMRWTGPRMFLYAPIATIRHFLNI